MKITTSVSLNLFTASYNDNVYKLSLIDPNKFTYEEFKKHGKSNGIKINEFSEVMHISCSTIRNHAKKGGGIIGPAYFYMLVGMIATRVNTTVVISCPTVGQVCRES